MVSGCVGTCGKLLSELGKEQMTGNVCNADSWTFSLLKNKIYNINHKELHQMNATQFTQFEDKSVVDLPYSMSLNSCILHVHFIHKV